MCRRNALNKTRIKKQKSEYQEEKIDMSTSHHQALQKIDINPKYVFHVKSAPFLPLFFLLVAFTKTTTKNSNMSVSQIARFARDQKFILSKTVKKTKLQ